MTSIIIGWIKSSFDPFSKVNLNPRSHFKINPILLVIVGNRHHSVNMTSRNANIFPFNEDIGLHKLAEQTSENECYKCVA